MYRIHHFFLSCCFFCQRVELKDDDEFIILACDGIWDCLTNEEAVKFVRDRIDESTPTEIGRLLCNNLLRNK